MLGKYRLKPSFLLEVAFLVTVWLIAWLVFNPPLAVLVFVIFTAYALVFAYENWLDNLSRRERAETRRSQRKESEPYRKVSDPSAEPRPSTSARELRPAEPAAAHSISERLTARLRGHTPEEETTQTPPAPRVEFPVPTQPAVVAPPPTFEPAPRRAAEKPRPKPQPEQRQHDEVVVPPLGSAPRSVSEAAAAPRTEPAPESRRQTEPEPPHSLMAEIAAGPEARKERAPVGGWNLWRLERLLADQPRPDPERDYERSMMLVYLREFADSDGQLPSEFDDLVREAFGDLVRGPASQ